MKKLIFYTSVIILIFTYKVSSQQFTKILNNEITNSPAPPQYSGVSWVDYNNDNHLDLFVNNNSLFKNNGNGEFTKISTQIGAGQNFATGQGNTWADFDNDGDKDVFVSGANSFLYRNDGDDVFTKITNGQIGNGFANRGWSSAFADYDNDGFVDLVISHPHKFVPGGSTNNHLLRNNGEGNFEKILSTDVSKELQPYTVATWSDFDNDNDMDLFIGTGPANGVSAPDFIYKNELTETGTANLKKITTGNLATELRDGQVWNWIDYDNDGDLDVYITNWGGGHTPVGLPNDLYKNENGSFTKITNQTIATDSWVSLASVWADFDNDGDLDCFVANDRSADSYYKNEGDGTFTSLTSLNILSTENKRAASAGDYDNDGKIDLVSVGSISISLFHNTTQNSNNWVSFNLEGKVSNRSAIGAKVRIKATINGKSYWQMREVSAQNSFNSQNDLRVHFGLGDATKIDSVKIEWPLGEIDEIQNIDINKFYNFIEGDGISEITAIDNFNNILPYKFELAQNYPNPFNPSTKITYNLPTETFVSLKIFDSLGKEIKTLVSEIKSSGKHSSEFNASEFSNGVYFYSIRTKEFTATKKMILLK